ARPSAGRLKVSDYGFVPLPAAPRRSRKGLRIGFVGTLAWHKGAHVLVDAAAKLRPDAFAVLLYGDPATFPAYAMQLEAAAAGLPVRFMGGFDEAQIREV